jgi:hypothetical protein
MVVGSLGGILLVVAPQLAWLLRWMRGRQKLAPLLARRASVQTGMQYPMYVMAIGDLLEVKELRPHQQLLTENKVVKAVEGMTIVSVSLEWLTLHHPECVCRRALEPRRQGLIASCHLTGSCRRITAPTASTCERCRAHCVG